MVRGAPASGFGRRPADETTAERRRRRLASAAWTEAKKQEHAQRKRARYQANREARRSGAAASSAENTALAAGAVKAEEEAEEEEEEEEYDPFAPFEKEEEAFVAKEDEAGVAKEDEAGVAKELKEEEEEGGSALCDPYFAEPGVVKEEEARASIPARLRERGLVPPHDSWDDEALAEDAMAMAVDGMENPVWL